MQQVEMHFSDLTLGTFFSLQQIMNGWVTVLTLKLLKNSCKTSKALAHFLNIHYT